MRLSHALLSGAIHVSYCHGVRPMWTKNTFSDNTAGLFPGALAFNPMTYAKVLLRTSRPVS